MAERRASLCHERFNDPARVHEHDLVVRRFAHDRERAILEDCQDAIGYRFNKPELLRSALTHTSGANTRAASNERLEFLGDAVITDSATVAAEMS